MQPHPKRFINDEILDDITQIVTPSAMDAIKASLANLNLSRGEALNASGQVSALKKAFNSGLDMGTFNYLLSPLRFHATNGRYFEIDDALNEMLTHTDIGRQAPASYFRPPFDSIYLYFNKPVEPLKVINEVAGSITPMEGVYITQVNSKTVGDIDLLKQAHNLKCRDFRIYELSFMGRAQTHPLECDITYTRIVIPEAWEDKPLEEVIELGFAASLSGGRSELSEQGFQVLKELVAHVAKAFLYIASEESIVQEVNELDDLNARLTRIKQAKRKKLEKQIARSYNFIRIGQPKQDTQQTGTPKGDIHKKASHWRRGHFRNQAYGEGRQKRKLIFIAPTLIGGIGDPTDKVYRVRK